MNSKEIHKNNRGQTVLVLVLITALIGMLSLILSQQLGIRQQQQLYDIEQIDTTYYAAEGALYETLKHLTTDSSWPASTIEDTYMINGVTIDRTVEPTTDGSGNPVRNVAIDADLDGIRRRVVGNDITFDDGGTTPVNLLLALDLSQSMWDYREPPPSNRWQPIYDTKESAKYFVSLLSGNDQAGLIGWGGGCNNYDSSVQGYNYVNCKYDWLEEEYSLMYGGSSHFNHMTANITSINTSSHEAGTSMYKALRLSREYLEDDAFTPTNPPADLSTTAMILLSDGLDNSVVSTCLDSNNEVDPGNVFNSLTAIRSDTHNGAVPVCGRMQAEDTGLWSSSAHYRIEDHDPDPDPLENGQSQTALALNPGGSVTWQFVITEEEYNAADGLFELYGETNAPDRDNSSFLVSMDSQDAKLWNNNNYGSNSWNWQSDNVPFEIDEPGIIDVTISYNEPDFWINRLALQPALGKKVTIDQAKEFQDLIITTTNGDITNIPIFTIGVGPIADDFTLTKIAEVTGGEYFEIEPDDGDFETILNAAYNSIVGTLRSGISNFDLNEEVP